MRQYRGRESSGGLGPIPRRLALKRAGWVALAATVGPTALGGCDALSSSSGDAWRDAVIAAPESIPTITASASSEIDKGLYVTPDVDLAADPHFRFDGCCDVFRDSAGVYAKPPEAVVPEIVTDAADIEAVFRAGRDGARVIGVRVVVDGKLSHLRLRRFDANEGASYFYKFHFSSAKLRHLKFEVDGANRFVGAVVGQHAVLQRPNLAYRLRHVAIGDSIQQGGANYHIGAEEPGDFYYMRWESHSRFQAALMGCDSYVNLGAGGTGWSETVPGDTFVDRVPLALACEPHVLGVYGSRNDFYNQEEVAEAVEEALRITADVPAVLVSGPQQAGFTKLNDLIGQAVLDAGRTWLDLNGVAASPDSNPTRHPTFDEQLALARAAFEQTHIEAVLESVQNMRRKSGG